MIDRTDRTTLSSVRAAFSWGVLAVALAAFSAFGLGGCNTVDGAGEDLQEASDNTSDWIDDATDDDD